MLKPLIIKTLRHRWLGAPAALAARAVGDVPTSRKISALCNFVPRRVPVDLPREFADGRAFTMDGGGLDLISRAMWWSGWHGFEKPLPDFFARLSRDARDVMDVGAYSGFYSLIAATCSPAARVYSFEPFPPPRDRLEKNVAINGFGDRIRVTAAAVSDQSGEANFYVPAHKTDLIKSDSSLNPNFLSEHLEPIRVPVTTLDEFVKSQGCGRIDLMKIDVETFEPQVLRGGFRAINESRPYIFLEILPEADPGALEAVRADLGYVSAQLHPTGIEWRDHIEPGRGGHDYVFCPAEKKDRFDEIAASLGYPAGLPVAS